MFLILILSLFSLISLSSQANPDLDQCLISRCNLLTSCNACSNWHEDCQWCQTDELIPTGFCTSKDHCSATNGFQSVERCPSLYADVCGGYKTCRSCNQASSNLKCGWCGLTYNQTAGYCTIAEECSGDLWKFNQPCQSEVTTNKPKTTSSTTVQPVSSTGTNVTTTTEANPGREITHPFPQGRCSGHRKCGTCVRAYLCSWCTNPDGSGYCVDESANSSEPAYCLAHQGRLNNQTCTCNGYAECNQCRINGCSWCGNGHNDFCFDLAVSSELSRCLNSSAGHLDFFCNAPNNQIEDPVVNKPDQVSQVDKQTNNSEIIEKEKHIPIIFIILIVLGIISYLGIIATVSFCIIKRSRNQF